MLHPTELSIQIEQKFFLHKINKKDKDKAPKPLPPHEGAQEQAHTLQNNPSGHGYGKQSELIIIIIILKKKKTFLFKKGEKI